MISCHRATEWASLELDTTVPAGRRFALGVHRMLCAACRRYRTQLAELDRAVAAAVAAGELAAGPLPDDARSRLARALADEQSG